jgi:hypothetical protein
MRIVVAIVAMSLLFGVAAFLDPSRVGLLVQWSVQGHPVVGYLVLTLEPFAIIGIAVLATRLRQWMLPIVVLAAVAALLAHAPLEFGAFLLAVSIMAWPPRWSRTHLRAA